MQKLPTIAVVTRETRLQGLVARFATKGAARFRMKQVRAHQREQAFGSQASAETMQALDEADELADFDEFTTEDETYDNVIRQLQHDLDVGFPLAWIDRAYLPTFDFGRCAAVVVVGQDGLVANTAKYVGDLPVIGINPEPERYDGVLLPFVAAQARVVLQRTLKERSSIREVTLAEAELNDGQRMLAFNELFVGARSHVSARYTLRVDHQVEPQSSSGVLISTGAGSTGWMSSLVNMANGFAQWLGGSVTRQLDLNWEDRSLVWAVREPFVSQQSAAALVAGRLEQNNDLVIESLMSGGGVIFSDGIESDFLEFNSGSIANIHVAAQKARLVVA